MSNYCHNLKEFLYSKCLLMPIKIKYGLKTLSMYQYQVYFDYAEMNKMSKQMVFFINTLCVHTTMKYYCLSRSAAVLELHTYLAHFCKVFFTEVALEIIEDLVYSLLCQKTICNAVD